MAYKMAFVCVWRWFFSNCGMGDLILPRTLLSLHQLQICPDFEWKPGIDCLQHAKTRFFLSELNPNNIPGLELVVDTGKLGANVGQVAGIGVLKECVSIGTHTPNAHDDGLRTGLSC